VCEKAQKQRLFELAEQLRSSDASVTVIRPGCQLLKEDNVNVANLSGNGEFQLRTVLLVSEPFLLTVIFFGYHSLVSAPTAMCIEGGAKVRSLFDCSHH